MKLVSWLILSSGNQCKCLTVTPFCHALVLRLKKEFSRACMRCRNTAAFIVNKKTGHKGHPTGQGVCFEI